MKVDYDAAADLHKSTLDKHEPGKVATFGSVLVWSGTLGGCINQYLAKPHSKRSLYSIVVGSEAGAEKTILEHKDIDGLAEQPDFLKWSGR